MVRSLLVLLAAFATALAPVRAQDKKVSISAAVVPATARPGDEVTLEVTLRIDDGWHVYGRDEETGIPPSLTIEDAGGLTPIGPAQIPIGVPHDAFGMRSYWVVGEAVLRQKLKVPEGAAAGALELKGKVDYMTCDEESCLPPDSDPFAARVTIQGGAGAAAIPEPDEDHKVTAGARFEPATVAPGGEAELIVTLRILDGWHVYGRDEETGIPPSVRLVEGGCVEFVGPQTIPAGEPHESFGIRSYWVKDEAVLRQKVKVPASAEAGPIDVGVAVDYMACNDEMCDPPSDLAARATLTVAGASVGAPTPPAPGPQDPFAGLGGGAPEVAFAARVEPAVARPGEVVDVVVSVAVPDGWHVYGGKDDHPITLSATDAQGLAPRGKNSLPDGTKHESGKLVNYWVAGAFELRQSFAVPTDAEVGARELKLAVDYLLCDASTCLPQKRHAFAVPLRIEAGAPRAEYAGPAPAGGSGPDEEEDDLGSIWKLVLAAIGAGLFALAMPCTYPMIPITISFFTKQASARQKSVLPLSLAYGAGIVLVFVLIGVIVGPAIVPFARHWVVNLVIAVLFLAFGLSLFGLFTLQPPRFLMNAASKASAQGGYHGVFLMGATLVVTSFTCTAPFVGTLLGSAASKGLGAVVIGMTVFGLTMAIPFVILSLLPGRMHAMPRAGEWMNTLKVTLGFVEVAASMKFFSNAEIVWRIGALPRELFLLLWAAIFFVAGLFLLGMFKLKDAETSIGAGRMTSGLVAMMFAAYCVFGTLGFRMDQIMTAIVPNYSAPSIHVTTTSDAGEGGSGDAEATVGHTIVKDDYERGLALAREQGKLLLVNFTGYT